MSKVAQLIDFGLRLVCAFAFIFYFTEIFAIKDSHITEMQFMLSNSDQSKFDVGFSVCKKASALAFLDVKLNQSTTLSTKSAQTVRRVRDSMPKVLLFSRNKKLKANRVDWFRFGDNLCYRMASMDELNDGWLRVNHLQEMGLTIHPADRYISSSDTWFFGTSQTATSSVYSIRMFRLASQNFQHDKHTCPPEDNLLPIHFGKDDDRITIGPTRASCEPRCNDSTTLIHCQYRIVYCEQKNTLRNEQLPESVQQLIQQTSSFSRNQSESWLWINLKRPIVDCNQINRISNYEFGVYVAGLFGTFFGVTYVQMNLSLFKLVSLIKQPSPIVTTLLWMLLMITSFFLCFKQVFELFSGYFFNEFVTTFDLQISETMPPFDVSMCVHPFDLLPRARLCRHLNNSFGSTVEERALLKQSLCDRHIGQTITLNQLRELSIENIRKLNQHRSEWEQLKANRLQLYAGSLCVTLNKSNPLLQMLASSVLENMAIGTFARTFRYIRTYLHFPGISYFSPSNRVHLKHPYQLFQINHIPGHGCFDYSRIKLQNKQHCWNRCVADALIKSEVNFRFPLQLSLDLGPALEMENPLKSSPNVSTSLINSDDLLSDFQSMKNRSISIEPAFITGHIEAECKLRCSAADCNRLFIQQDAPKLNEIAVHMRSNVLLYTSNQTYRVPFVNQLVLIMCALNFWIGFSVAFFTDLFSLWRRKRRHGLRCFSFGVFMIESILYICCAVHALLVWNEYRSGRSVATFDLIQPRHIRPPSLVLCQSNRFFVLQAARLKLTACDVYKQKIEKFRGRKDTGLMFLNQSQSLEPFDCTKSQPIELKMFFLSDTHLCLQFTHSFTLKRTAHQRMPTIFAIDFATSIFSTQHSLMPHGSSAFQMFPAGSFGYFYLKVIYKPGLKCHNDPLPKLQVLQQTFQALHLKMYESCSPLVPLHGACTDVIGSFTNLFAYIEQATQVVRSLPDHLSLPFCNQMYVRPIHQAQSMQTTGHYLVRWPSFEFVVEYRLKESLSEFIIILLSLIGIWLNLSIVDVTHWIKMTLISLSKLVLDHVFKFA